MTTSAKKIKPCPPGFSDHIYKVEHGVQVPLRIWPSPSVSEPAPWLFWIHGGGFQAGKHFVPNAWVHHAFNSRSYHIVSVAYRFAPECSMDEIFQDVTDAFHWCRSHLPQILGAVDIDNYVVGGDSAGGTLSTMCGHLLEPRPRVVLDLFGVVDNLDPEFMRHDPNSHIQSMPYEKADRDEDELRALLASRDKSKAAVTGAWSWELAMPLEDLKTFWGIKEYDTEEDTLRMDAFIYIAKSGMRLDNLYRREECASDQEFEERLKSWSSLLRLQGQTTYPPTYIIHGIADTAVPVGQSYRFQKKLEEMGVDTGASYAPGAEHSFDSQISSPEDAGWDEYIEPCMRFIDKHLKAI